MLCIQAHKTICERESKHSNDPKGRLFYLALPPSVYPEVTQGIKENCTDVEVGEGGFLRVIVEKPFGKVTPPPWLPSSCDPSCDSAFCVIIPCMCLARQPYHFVVDGHEA